MRADRLISMMLLLQSRRRLTAEELSRKLEVSVRTIYRDIDALGVAGIPVYTQSGTNGGVFLDENYRVRLTNLSPAELETLVVGRNSRPLNDLGLGRKSEDSVLKLLAALPAVQREEVQRMRQRVFIDTEGWFHVDQQLPHLGVLQQAVWEDRFVSFLYRRPDSTVTERTVEAYSLVTKANIWYLVARKASGDYRTYRVSRIHEPTLSDAGFERDPDFDLQDHWQQVTRSFEQQVADLTPAYRATLHCHPDALRDLEYRMADRFVTASLPDADQWTTLTIEFASALSARRNTLALGSLVHVVAPTVLREAVLADAHALLAHYERTV